MRSIESLSSSPTISPAAGTTPSLPDALPILPLDNGTGKNPATTLDPLKVDPRHYALEFENPQVRVFRVKIRSQEHTCELKSRPHLVSRPLSDNTQHKTLSGYRVNDEQNKRRH